MSQYNPRYSVRARTRRQLAWFAALGAAISLLTALAPRMTLAQATSAYTLNRSDAQTRILHELHAGTTVDFVESPLSDVVQYLEDYHNVQIEFDLKRLEEVGTSTDAPVSRQLKNVSLANALDLILGELELDFLVTKDVLLITSQEAAHAATEIRIYQLQELLTDERNSESVGELLKQMYAKDPHHELVVAPLGEVLLIRDTQRGHHEIDQLLATLRLALARTVQPPAQALSTPASKEARPAEDSSAATHSPGETPAKADADPFQQP
ncbi:MAG: hypothetical protein JNG90_02835 [Planctomycetaceae bacterium]|nr:hypothetical protein [Planctomycetaceae bacterium]